MTYQLSHKSICKLKHPNTLIIKVKMENFVVFTQTIIERGSREREGGGGGTETKMGSERTIILEYSL